MGATSFYWHDYETFGRVPRRDRPAQFAGLRTDAELNEIGQPLMLYCQPAPDYLPDPESCLLTGILPQTCLEQGVPEYAFAAAVERELAAPDTVGVGYNSIRFDDEVTRCLFWRNLMDPYAREHQNGCGRWDLLDVVRCCYALRPGGIEWPQAPDGRASFRLTDLTAANSLVHDSAHDALSDVRATLALARLVRAQQPRLWDYCLGLRHKGAVWDVVNLAAPKPFLHVSGMYPSERGSMAVVWPLAMHPTNRNEVIVWDLSTDPQELAALDAEAIRARLFVRQDELPSGVQRLPIKTIHVNRSPIVIGNLKTLGDAQAERWGVDLAAIGNHAAQAAALSAQLPASLWAAVYAREARDAGDDSARDVDEDLYGGFIGQHDRRLLESLRQRDPAEMAAATIAFEDTRLEEMWFRFRARNFPQTLSADEQDAWRAHCADRLHRGKDGALTLAEHAARIDALAESADARGEAILGALVDYAEQIAPPA